SMPANAPCLIPWPTTATLNQVVTDLGATFADHRHSSFSHTLYFGTPLRPVPDSLAVICSGWRGGVAPAENPVTLSSQTDFALGGVLAAALGVAKGFLRISGLSSRYIEGPEGVSLWRPDIQ